MGSVGGEGVAGGGLGRALPRSFFVFLLFLCLFLLPNCVLNLGRCSTVDVVRASDSGAFRTARAASPAVTLDSAVTSREYAGFQGLFSWTMRNILV